MCSKKGQVFPNELIGKILVSLNDPKICNDLGFYHPVFEMKYTMLDACHDGHLNIIKYLYNINPSTKYIKNIYFTKSNEILLSSNIELINVANEYNHLEIVKFFYNCEASDKNYDDKFMVKLIMDACRFGNFEIVEYFGSLNKCFIKSIFTDAAIDIAIQKRDYKTFRFLKRFYREECVPTKWALDHVIQNNDFKMIKYLYFHHKIKANHYSIFYASVFADMEILKFLYKYYKARVDNSHHLDCIYIATKYNRIDIVKYLYFKFNAKCTQKAINTAREKNYVHIQRFLEANI